MTATTGVPRPVTVAIRVDECNPAHVYASLFVGRNRGARGHSGDVVFHTDELAELVRCDPDLLIPGTVWEVDVTPAVRGVPDGR